MTTEEKFKKLLEIAVNNGFDCKESILLSVESNKKFTIKDYLFISYPRWEYSLNDLVLNTNFFECLFKNALPCFYTGNFEMTIIHQYKHSWFLEVENGNALQWLFKQLNL